jgi:hypothetical protein
VITILLARALRGRSFVSLWLRVSLLFAAAVIVGGIAQDAGLAQLPGKLHLPHPKAPRHGAAQPPAASPAPSATARADIPAAYLTLYQQSARIWCPGLPWTVLAGIGKVESNHGRSTLPGVRSGLNTAGAGCCAGPMQFNVTNGPPSTWDRYGRGGNVYDPADAIPAAARLLCADGAARPGGLWRAVYAYNHAAWYVAEVLGWARRYSGGAR